MNRPVDHQARAEDVRWLADHGQYEGGVYAEHLRIAKQGQV